jgi:Zn-dependent protease/CBS domain-containing protein
VPATAFYSNCEVSAVKNSIRLGRVAGIDVGIHYTWVFAFALIAWSLAAGFFPSSAPGASTATYWLLGIAAALGLFASVLIHEFSHSLVALARGLRVHSITLFIFGGVSSIAGEAERALDEFLVAVVGPVSSFVLAGVFWVIGQVAGLNGTPLGAFVGYLASVNLILGLFNLVPGFPLDGGRVLRSIVWASTGSLRRATQVASYVGQGFGFLLIFWGVARLLGGDVFGGLWTAFIGWFLNNGAEATRQQQALTEDLRGASVAQVMDPQPATASPSMTVHEFVFDHVVRRGERALLVAEAGQLLGIVTITDAKELPQELWAATPVRRIMTSVPLKSVAVDADLAAALQLMVEDTLNQVPVVQADRIVGLLRREDVLRYLQLRDKLHLAGDGRVSVAGRRQMVKEANR